jgi:AcrR family transcriptional regulator
MDKHRGTARIPALEYLERATIPSQHLMFGAHADLRITRPSSREPHDRVNPVRVVVINHLSLDGVMQAPGNTPTSRMSLHVTLCRQVRSRDMGRWEPNARGRLEAAALELYGEYGFDQTTVAQIAERAGLTARTFFRYFADKREVLFWGAAALQDFLTSGVAKAPDSLAPIEAVTTALEAADTLFTERRELARQRQSIIAANPELQERELIKLASLSAALADALRQRGVKDPAASLTAEAGIAVFKIAFERWVDETNEQGFGPLVRESLGELKAVTAGRSTLAVAD